MTGTGGGERSTDLSRPCHLHEAGSDRIASSCCVLFSFLGCTQGSYKGVSREGRRSVNECPVCPQTQDALGFHFLRGRGWYFGISSMSPKWMWHISAWGVCLARPCCSCLKNPFCESETFTITEQNRKQNKIPPAGSILSRES